MKRKKKPDPTPPPYKRYTVNAPPNLARMIDARIVEIPYNSESAYFLALAIFDCWSRREHKMTARLMAQPGKVRDAVFAQIVDEFEKGNPPEKQGWFDHFITRLVEAELQKANGDPR